MTNAIEENKSGEWSVEPLSILQINTVLPVPCVDRETWRLPPSHLQPLFLTKVSVKHFKYSIAQEIK